MTEINISPEVGAKTITLGVDYYPEHWDESDWDRHASLMSKAHLKVARIAEFAWSRLQPEENRFEFGWLDSAIESLSHHGIKIILGTPTAAPPAWMCAKYPEILPVDETGYRYSFGSRRHRCVNSPALKHETTKIVEAMAERYGTHPFVEGWQIDNELGTGRCYCNCCADAFREWLKKKYGTLDTINRLWGTVFWSQEYAAWEEIPIPKKTLGRHNPSLLLDFARFFSDSNVDYIRLQTEIIRRHSPGRYITTNTGNSPRNDLINQYHFFREQDYAGINNYPGPEDDPAYNAFMLDFLRGIKGKDYIVLEQQAASTGITMMDPITTPAEIRRWTYQAIARGAEKVLYFRWRTCPFGGEQYCQGILDYDGYAGPRHEGIKRTGAELERLAVKDTSVQSKIAILFTHDSKWALDIDPHNRDYNYIDHILCYYRAFHARHIPVDVIGPDEDFTKYEAIITPSLFIGGQKIEQKLAAYVEQGGNLISTFRSLVKDENNTVPGEGLLGGMQKVFGIKVREYDSFRTGEHNQVTLQPSQESYKAGVWCDILEPEGAEILAEYKHKSYAGSAAITINRFGRGWAAYIGFLGDGEFYKAFAERICREHNIFAAVTAPEDVEVVERTGPRGRVVFLLNHSSENRTVPLPPGANALLDTCIGGSIELEPYGVEVVEFSEAADRGQTAPVEYLASLAPVG